jgi:methylglutaconyl-CoA hydratase
MAVVLTERTGDVLRITLNRPEVRNAFDEDVIARLTAAAREAAASPGLRAVVLAGSGKAFCAGADLAWMTKAIAYTREENRRDAEDLARMLDLFDRLPVPVVARIHGAALGGGAGLVAVCDVAVAAEDATFGFTEVKLGIIPAVISPYVVSKIGASAARELFLTGGRFGAARALQIGLVHQVVPESGLDAAVEACLQELRTSSPAAISAAKRLIQEVARARPADVIGLTTTRIAEQRVSSEGQEGMRAFLEKRKPDWIGPKS